MTTQKGISRELANNTVQVIDLRKLLKILWNKKLFIFIITVVFALGSMFYAISVPNKYKSEIVVMSNSTTEDQGMLSSIAGQFGGLASLAGVNLGSGTTDKVTYALEVIKSRTFIYEFITKYDLFLPLMAAEDWERETDTFIFDSDIYDFQTKSWVREVPKPYLPKPSLEETYEEFLKKNLEIKQDKNTGMVKISIIHYSPILARYLAERIVVELNDSIKEQELIEAKNSISYLEKELLKTNVQDMRGMFYQLIEKQYQKLMLTKTRKDYVLKIVDAPIVPEMKDSPSRALICVIGTMLGALLSILYIMFMFFIRAYK